MATEKLNQFIYSKIPPQAIELEEVVLGSMMLESNCINTVFSIIQPDSFYKNSHQVIARAISELYRQNKPVDILTVSEYLISRQELNDVGGALFITTLTTRITSTANIEYHTRIILQKHIQREIIRRCSEIIEEGYSENTEPLDLVDRFGRDYDSLSTLAQSGAEMSHISVALYESEIELRKREDFAKKGQCAGIPTPINELNRMLGGWINSDLIIIAARPGMGKTAFMLQVAKKAAQYNHPVCCFSLEMSKVSLTNRMILAESEINDDNFRRGYISQEDWSRFHQAKNILSALPIYIDDRAGLSIHQIKAKALQMKRSNRCDIVLIDYLQLTSMKSENRQYNREQEVSESSRLCKGMAKIMDVPVILLSQLSRESEKRGGAKIPMLSDLRDSGSIEQDADIVIFPHRESYYDKEKPENEIDFHVAKHRNGPTGVIHANCNESLTKIFDRTYENEQIDYNKNLF